MPDFARQIRDFKPAEGKLGLVWLGQAGFVLKNSKGYTIAIDLYLSETCESSVWTKRLVPTLVTAEELTPDAVFITHLHGDHYDKASVKTLMRNPATKLVASKDVQELAEADGIPAECCTYLAPGEGYECDAFKLTAIPCDHGQSAPLAIGLRLEFGGKTLVFAGDSSYRADWYRRDDFIGADIVIVPINGGYGNMDEAEAARAVSIMRPALAVPEHYWCMVGHGGDPGKFLKALERCDPSIPCFIPALGECAEL